MLSIWPRRSSDSVPVVSIAYTPNFKLVEPVLITKMALVMISYAIDSVNMLAVSRAKAFAYMTAAAAE